MDRLILWLVCCLVQRWCVVAECIKGPFIRDDVKHVILHSPSPFSTFVRIWCNLFHSRGHLPPRSQCYMSNSMQIELAATVNSSLAAVVKASRPLLMKCDINCGLS